MPPKSASTLDRDVNTPLILVLSKMGYYMQRDQVALIKMTPTARSARLRRAFDDAIEDCCIFPLLFSDKVERRMGALELSARQKWVGWEEDKSHILRPLILASDESFKPMVTVLGAFYRVYVT